MHSRYVATLDHLYVPCCSRSRCGFQKYTAYSPVPNAGFSKTPNFHQEPFFLLLSETFCHHFKMFSLQYCISLLCTLISLWDPMTQFSHTCPSPWKQKRKKNQNVYTSFTLLNKNTLLIFIIRLESPWPKQEAQISFPWLKPSSNSLVNFHHHQHQQLTGQGQNKPLSCSLERQPAFKEHWV